MQLPNKIFFTGVPGSRWSGIAQTLEDIPGFNSSDRTPNRDYSHAEYSGHKGAYFGRGMEFEAILIEEYVNQAHVTKDGCRLIKGHDWAYVLPDIKERFPHDWIMLVYRPDLASFAWWHEAGGFSIKYPDYSIYKNSRIMMQEIQAQNEAILEFAYSQNATWSHFTQQWVDQTFGLGSVVKSNLPDILVAVIK
jgi:hypothetical protein